MYPPWICGCKTCWFATAAEVVYIADDKIKSKSSRTPGGLFSLCGFKCGSLVVVDSCLAFCADWGYLGFAWWSTSSLSDRSDICAIQQFMHPETGIYPQITSQLNCHFSCDSRFHHPTTTLSNLTSSLLLWISDCFWHTSRPLRPGSYDSRVAVITLWSDICVTVSLLPRCPVS